MREGTVSVRTPSHALSQTGRARPGREPGARPIATSGAWRLVRGGAVGTVATGLAWAGHVWAGGERPEPWLLLAAAGGVGLASVALSRYRWSVPSLTAMLLGVQALLHALFEQTSPDPVVHQASHHLAGHHLAAGRPADGSMTLAHVLAAVATAWVLARGENWLWLLLELLALRGIRLLRPAHRTLAVGTPALIPAWRLPSQRAGLGAWSLRGPPVVSR